MKGVIHHRVSRRAVLAGGLATLAVHRAVAAELPRLYGPAPLSGDRLDPRGDDSGQIVPAPPPGYWPYSGLSGPGRPSTDASASGGWVSGLPDVRYKGPVPRRYPCAPWDNADAGTAVKAGLLPHIRPLHDVHIRDTIVCLGGDGAYYMTGSTGDNIWAMNDGVELWRSTDLFNWEYLGLVWSIERDGGWEKNWRMRKGVPFRALWAPEIHYIRGNYYICHSMSRAGLAVLKSTTGRAEGPYVHAFSPDKPLRHGIDATLFEDDDGSVWLTYGSADEIVRLKDDLSGYAEDWRPVTAAEYDTDPSHHRAQCAERDYKHLGYEGATLFKRNGVYYLGVVDRYEGRYSFALWMADKITGPYRNRHEVPDCGGGNFLKDARGNWWVTCFGNGETSHFREKPGLVKIDFAPDGRVVIAPDQPFAIRTEGGAA
ncbi:family 43 glycosylhydrolase [Pedomonas mirosovicensis]|uniref:family 43 glycosylhydrolase n=1 Tax=Pedomonas mirosovicensis TaxID=2908641 RepID=UPI00216968A1|nr:family 43 glycosylhydrolase [Pedomonas mirosovicensis]MCH8686206.1 family 43 glycosylhydrolase [Pedomonas mirosovicensis]